MRKCIVIQGPDTKLSNIIKNHNTSNTIISSWEGSYLNNGFMYIENKMPNGRYSGNLNLQAMTTLSGCLLAKQLGFDYVLKIRSDIEIDDPDKLLNLLDPDKFCFYTFVKEPQPKRSYLADFIVGGPVDDMIKMWSLDKVNTDLCPEEQLTLRFLNLSKTQDIEFLMPIMIENEISCFWHRLNYDLRKNYGDYPYFDYNPNDGYSLQYKGVMY